MLPLCAPPESNSEAIYVPFAQVWTKTGQSHVFACADVPERDEWTDTMQTVAPAQSPKPRSSTATAAAAAAAAAAAVDRKAAVDEPYAQPERGGEDVVGIADQVEGERAGMLPRDIDLEQVAVAEKRVAKSDSGIETGRSNKRRDIFLAVFCLLVAGAFIPLCYYWYLDHTGAMEEAVAPVALQKSRLASTATYSGITQAGVSNLSTATRPPYQSSAESPILCALQSGRKVGPRPRWLSNQSSRRG